VAGKLTLRPAQTDPLQPYAIFWSSDRSPQVIGCSPASSWSSGAGESSHWRAPQARRPSAGKFRRARPRAHDPSPPPATAESGPG